jgi:hypothetical protein
MITLKLILVEFGLRARTELSWLKIISNDGLLAVFLMNL